MTIDKSLLEGITDEELSVLLRLVAKLNNITDVIEVSDKALQTFLGYGRDKNDQVLTSLVEKGYISREQQRDPLKGTFAKNLIKIKTDKVKI